MLKLNTTYCIDNLQGMSKIKDEYADMFLTSPPYDRLRDYKGFSWDVAELSREIFRVLKQGGVCIWVVGDQVVKGSETGTSFEHALQFKKNGFNIHDTMIYQKKGISSPSHVRYNQCFEYMFVFSKGKPKTINLIKDKRNIWTGVYTGKRTQRERDGHKSISRKKEVPVHSIRDNVWIYNVGYLKSTLDKIAYNHPAIFPEALAKDHILSWTNEDDIVIDPFMGSGTTGKICVLLNRKYIGFEISPEYTNLANERNKKWEKIQGRKLFK